VRATRYYISTICDLLRFTQLKFSGLICTWQLRAATPLSSAT